MLVLLLLAIAAIWLHISLGIDFRGDTASTPLQRFFDSPHALAIASTGVVSNLNSSNLPYASTPQGQSQLHFQSLRHEAEPSQVASIMEFLQSSTMPTVETASTTGAKEQPAVDDFEAWLKVFNLSALAPKLRMAGVDTLENVRAISRAPDGDATAVSTVLGPTVKKLDLVRVTGAVQFLFSSENAFISSRMHNSLDSLAGATLQNSSVAQLGMSKPIAIPPAAAKDITAKKPDSSKYIDLNAAPGRIASHWASFPAGPPAPHWSGNWQRSDNQIDLNLLQGEYENIRVPWLQSFASRTTPHDCPTSRTGNEQLDPQSLGPELSRELLIVHSRFVAAEVKLHEKSSDDVRATLLNIQSQTVLSGRALVMTSDGPYDSCATLTAANACGVGGHCISVTGLGPCCPLRATNSSVESRSNGRSGVHSGTWDGSAPILLWPAGLSQAEDRLEAFNRVLAPLFVDSAVADDAASSSTYLQTSLTEALGLDTIGLVACLARDDILPSGPASDNYYLKTGTDDDGVPWVVAAARLLRRNRRLAVASCFPKYPGTTYVDAPEYFHVPFKLLTYGLGLEDCTEADVDAALKLHTPFAMKDASGSMRERFAYAPFSPYGPQCYDVDTLRAALPHLSEGTSVSAHLFRAADERPLGVGAEVDLHLRLWRYGNASVGVLDCGLEEPFPREEVFPSGAGLIADNATKYAPSKLLKMVKTQLLNMQSKNEIAEPATAVAAREVQLAVALANHRLFQQRQALLWPQATALDSTHNFNYTEPIPMMAQAGCQAFASDLPLRKYGDPTEGLTLVLMSYAGGVGGASLSLTLQHYRDNFSKDLLREIVLVWNSPEELLPADIRAMSKDSSHHGAVRIVCFDTNSLLNRFHPRVAPKTRAVVFGDDDKRMAEASLRIGYLKWCCGNADRAVGGIGRRFWASKTGIEYHTSGRMQDIQMVIPTGMIIDRGYLCHFWRRAFEPLHNFVNYSPSKPDDIAMNLLVQHLSGKGPRNYPQVVDRPGQLPAVTRRRRLVAARHQQQGSYQRRRRILRSKKNATAAVEGNDTEVDVYSADSQSSEPQGLRRRRLGMAGAAVWPLWRSDGALWTAYFFGGVPRISPGYCNEGIPVAKWKRGCDNTVPVEDLPAAYGRVAAIAANDPNLAHMGGARNAVPKPGQLLWEVGAYHGPKALPWLASCNASALFQAQEAQLRKPAQVMDHQKLQGARNRIAKLWLESEGLLLSTTASTANDGSLADSKAQDVWDTVRNIAAMNPEIQVTVTGVRVDFLSGAPTSQDFYSIDANLRQRIFLRDKVSMLRQSLIVDTIPSFQTPNAAREAASSVASEAATIDDRGTRADGARLFLDALLRGLDDSSPEHAFNRTTWLDPAVAVPCKKTLIPVPWLRPHSVAATFETSNGTIISTPNATGAESEAAAEEWFQAARKEAPWVLWADFAALAAPGEVLSTTRQQRPAAAGWTHADAVAVRGRLEALRARWADSSALPKEEDVKLVLEGVGWEQITVEIPSTRTPASTVRIVALPGACARSRRSCPPSVPCTCPYTDCRVLISKL